MNAVDRFAKRKALGLPGALPSPVSTAIPLPADPMTAADSTRLSAAIEQALRVRSDERFDQRLRESKMVLLRSVAVPFGLGHIVAAHDRIGGDVHTVHNVRKGHWASDDMEEAYNKRGNYADVKDACHQTDSYIEANRAASQQRNNGELRDAYTGELLPAGKGGHDLDHVISAKAVFDDAGAFLAGSSTAELSTKPENLAPTHRSVNRSKKAMTPEQYAAWLKLTESDRKAQIAKLEAQESMTEAEQKTYNKLKAQDSVDPTKLKEKQAEAQAAIDEQVNRDWYASGAFAREVLLSTGKSAAKSSLMAAFGEFLIEFLAASFDELRDLYMHGTGGEPVFDDLKARLERVAARVVARKEAALEAFGSGALGGVIAALISAIINTFKTTSKRVARLLREGGQSLVRAVLTLAMPGDGVTTRESLFAAAHLVIGSSIVLGGVCLEEVIETSIKTSLPPIAFLAEPIAVVIAGVVSGMAVLLTSAMLDKLDPLGVNEEQDLRALNRDLDSQIEAARTALLPSF